MIDAAVALLAAGRQPTVSEVADSAEVSRRTAYRYFPTQEKLHAEAALDGLRPVMESAIAAAPAGDNDTDVEVRVDKLVESMQRLAIENESLLRTMIHQTVLERPVSGEPRRAADNRKTRMFDIICHASRFEVSTPLLLGRQHLSRHGRIGRRD